jgi:hypothetical protein
MTLRPNLKEFSTRDQLLHSTVLHCGVFQGFKTKPEIRPSDDVARFEGAGVVRRLAVSGKPGFGFALQLIPAAIQDDALLAVLNFNMLPCPRAN